jgi:hypothetical protein
MKSTVDPKNTFVIYMDIMLPVQLVTYSPVSHIRMCFMDFRDLVCDSFVLQLMAALRML